MKVKTYYMNILRMNNEEIPRLPPNFNNAQKIPNDELVDILLFGTPKSWQREMDRQGFDPLTHTAQQVIDFMERIEMTEDFDSDKKTATVTKKNGKKNTNSTNQSAEGGSKYCMMHGKNTTHDTSECKTLKAQIKKIKGDGDTPAKKGKGGKNKTWKNKSEKGTAESKKELAALTKQVKDLSKKLELHSVEKEPVKKRKVKWPSAEEEKDEMDLAALDAELKDFSYGDLDKMDINDKDDDDQEDGEVSDEVSV